MMYGDPKDGIEQELMKRAGGYQSGQGMPMGSKPDLQSGGGYMGGSYMGGGTQMDTMEKVPMQKQLPAGMTLPEDGSMTRLSGVGGARMGGGGIERLLAVARERGMNPDKIGRVGMNDTLDLNRISRVGMRKPDLGMSDPYNSGQGGQDGDLQALMQMIRSRGRARGGLF